MKNEVNRALVAKKKLTILFAALTLSVGLWANELDDAKTAAIGEIETARQGIQNENLNKWIDGAIKDIQNGGPDATPGIDEIKEEVLNLIKFFKDGKAEGIEEGKAELLGNMAEPCTGCTAVEVTDGTTTVTLYKPTNVGYIKK